ncbi:hypothetical protein BAVI_18262 [Neobacillus vireti LMG 21834]|uniref:Uncharacterized protein n=1 Tax=Neobacillus vireti LMG 21834 TaxID=1131730 RepID=A0AB94IJR2_9BACI|nr:hypothetical protein BAVI_18262 [Neobacillus vireti LMG 21834]KLT18052.1 hypothetical protein AA980_10250 [Neobacillus vireti]
MRTETLSLLNINQNRSLRRTIELTEVNFENSQIQPLHILINTTIKVRVNMHINKQKKITLFFLSI